MQAKGGGDKRFWGRGAGRGKREETHIVSRAKSFSSVVNALRKKYTTMQERTEAAGKHEATVRCIDTRQINGSISRVGQSQFTPQNASHSGAQPPNQQPAMPWGAHHPLTASGAQRGSMGGKQGCERGAARRRGGGGGGMNE